MLIPQLKIFIYPAILVFLLAANISISAQPERLTDKDIADTLNMLSKEARLDQKDISILSASKKHLPAQKKEIRLYKILNKQTKETLSIALDSKNRVIDYNAILKREAKLNFKKYGNLQPTLYHLVKKGGERKISVIILLNIKEKPFNKSKISSIKESQRFISEINENKNQVDEMSMKVLSSVLESVNKKPPDKLKRSGPFVMLHLNQTEILKLSKHKDIAFIGLHDEQDVLDHPTIDESLPTTGTNSVHDLGVTGNGVNITVLERGTTSVAANCFNIASTRDTTAGVNSHMTKSVGIIGNRYSAGACTGAWTGYAPDATVLLANGNDSNCGNYPERYDWAANQLANIITMSWHCGSEETDSSLHARDIYFDYAATHYPWPTIFTSAGNQADEGAYASGKGYNFFGVGNVINDGDGWRCNDEMADSSSWKNPSSPHGDREVPEIASPGSRHAMLGSSFGGTSAATPVTASVAALLMDANQSLTIWPEAIRAILQSSATYQKADGANWSLSADGKDGAGMTHALRAYHTAVQRSSSSAPHRNAHDYGSLSSSSFGANKYLNKDWKIDVNTTNSRVRVALTWNSWAFRILFFSFDLLAFDLDLRVYDPDGLLVASSSSWDSSYELVTFKPQKVGTYTIKVYGYKVPSELFTYYGVAWTSYYKYPLAGICWE